MDWLGISPGDFWARIAPRSSELTLEMNELTLSVLGPWLGVLLWLLLLALPLKGVYRSDSVTGSLYVLFLLASAMIITLRFGCPWLEHPLDSHLGIFFCTVLGLSLWRWSRGSRKKSLIKQERATP